MLCYYYWTYKCWNDLNFNEVNKRGQYHYTLYRFIFLLPIKDSISLYSVEYHYNFNEFTVYCSSKSNWLTGTWLWLFCLQIPDYALTFEQGKSRRLDISFCGPSEIPFVVSNFLDNVGADHLQDYGGTRQWQQ